MNNTQTLQAIKLLSRLSAIEPSKYNQMSANLSKMARERRKAALSRQTTSAEWEATQSEWDYINLIEGVSDILHEPEEVVLGRLSFLIEQLTAQRPLLKIVFFVQEYSLWASFRTIYEYYLSLGKCTIELVYVYSENSISEKEKDKNVRSFRENGYTIIEMADFDLSSEAPDVVFYLKPYKGFNGAPPKFYIEEVSKHVRYTVFVSYCLDVQGGKDLVKYFYAQPMMFHAWKVISYSTFYTNRLKRYSYRDADNLVETGHPKFDGISDLSNNGEFCDSAWNAQIGNRSVVLWNTHFSIKDNEGVGTFFENKDAVFEYFKSNKEKVLLWRPHPYFWSCLEEDPRVGEDGLAALIDEVEKMGNVIIDNKGDYRYAFAAADALLSDATTFLAEFAITGKPVMYTPKSNGESVINEVYLREIEVCSGKASLFDFLNSIKTNAERNEQRRLYYEKVFGACDGRNGQRIGKYICDAIEQDCDEYANDFLVKVS